MLKAYLSIHPAATEFCEQSSITGVVLFTPFLNDHEKYMSSQSIPKGRLTLHFPLTCDRFPRNSTRPGAQFLTGDEICHENT